MAEFHEVLKQWNRMCKAVGEDCDRCSIKGSPCQYISFGILDLSSNEQPIMKWAEEHPEPVYPVWRDWLRDLYGNPNMTMTDILESPINPEIAQRLNIPPRRSK